LRRRVTRKLTSLKSALSFRAWSAAIPAKTIRIAAFSALFVVSALVTLLILLSGRRGIDAVAERENAPVTSVEQLLEDFSGSGAPAGQAAGMRLSAVEAPSVQDFILPQDVKGDSPEPHLLRPRLERWGEEQVGRYWIPLEDIALDLLRRENDRRIEQLFEDIP
jgi:hypothetical protein